MDNVSEASLPGPRDTVMSVFPAEFSAAGFSAAEFSAAGLSELV
jgi:hypothetical protein